MKRPRSSLLVLLAAVALPAAAEWYRYVNEDGVVVLSESIPPSLVHRGYEVLGDDGKVKRVVPRELTAAQVAAREAEEAARKLDENLLTLYSSPGDVEDARDRKLRSIDSEINRIKGNMERLRLKKARLEAQGADRERAGQPPSPEIVENLQIVAIQIRDIEKDIAARQQEQAQLRESFERDLARVRVLLGDKAGSEADPDASQGDEAAPSEADGAQADATGADARAAGMNTAAASSGH